MIYKYDNFYSSKIYIYIIRLNKMLRINHLYRIVDEIVCLQIHKVSQWHQQIETEQDLTNDRYCNVVLNHLMNFKLWHIEDTARRRDVSQDVIANCKYEIDILNQKRTNYYENITIDFMTMLSDCLPKVSHRIINTETVGMIIDRLSILSLKIYHMQEQTNRRTKYDDDYKTVYNKLELLEQQHKDLIAAFKYLLKEFLEGTKRPHNYQQLKMYNDATLNPELYSH